MRSETVVFISVYVFELLAKNQNSQLIGLNVLKWIALCVREPDSKRRVFLPPMAASRGESRPGTRQKRSERQKNDRIEWTQLRLRMSAGTSGRRLENSEDA